MSESLDQRESLFRGVERRCLHRGPWLSRRRGGLSLLFAALIVVHLSPIWWWPYFPSQDGPSHVDNALVLKDHASEPLYQQYYRRRAEPLPNWFIQATLVVLLWIAPPFLAEKILLTIYAILLPLALAYLSRAAQPVWGEIGLLVGCLSTYHFLLYMGFYNFSFGVIFYLLVVGYWWRRQDRCDGRSAAVLNLLLILTYFCHIVPLVLALATLGLLAMATADRQSRRRRVVFFTLYLLPAYVLPAWYLLRLGLSAEAGWGPPHSRFRYLTRLGSLAIHSDQYPCYRLLLLVLAVLVALSVADRLHLFERHRARGPSRVRLRRSDAFYLAFLLILGIYFATPNEVGSGSMIAPRVALFPLLVLVPALRPGDRPLIRGAIASALGALLVAQVFFLHRHHVGAAGELEELTSGILVIEPRSTLLPLLFEHRPSPRPRVNALLHAGGYYAAKTGGVDLSNYEADSDHFPTAFRQELRPGLERPSVHRMQTSPEDYRPARYVERIRYLVTWEMDPGSRVAGRIRKLYRPLHVSEGGRLRIFERRAHVVDP